MPNITCEGKKSEKTTGDVTTYTLTLTICNKDTTDIKIKVASNAWMEKVSNDKKEIPVVEGPDGKTDMGATRKKVIKDTWKNPETNNDDPLSIPAGKCKDYVINWKTKPSATYIDIFVMNADGSLPDKFEGTGFNKTWDDIALASFNINGPKENYCCTFPIPYPMALESVWKGPIKIAIDRVDGIPNGVELLNVFPPIGVGYPLDAGDRGSVGVLVLRQYEAVSGRHTISVSYKVSEPHSLRGWGRVHLLTLVPGEVRGRSGAGKLPTSTVG